MKQLEFGSEFLLKFNAINTLASEAFSRNGIKSAEFNGVKLFDVVDLSEEEQQKIVREMITHEDFDELIEHLEEVLFDCQRLRDQVKDK